MYNDYDLMCILYLGMEINEILLKNKHLYIDLYYDKIKVIYNDYKKYDNNNKSLLDSILDYINDNKTQILDTIKNCYE